MAQFGPPRILNEVVGGYVAGDGAPRGRPDDPNVAAPAIAPLPPNGGGRGVVRKQRSKSLSVRGERRRKVELGFLGCRRAERDHAGEQSRSPQQRQEDEDQGARSVRGGGGPGE